MDNYKNRLREMGASEEQIGAVLAEGKRTLRALRSRICPMCGSGPLSSYPDVQQPGWTCFHCSFCSFLCTIAPSLN